MIRTIITWSILALIEVFGVLAIWLLATGWWRPYPHAPIAHVLFGVLLGIAPVAAFFVAFLAPVWISTSRLMVKRAIDNAYRKNYEIVRSFLFTRGWLIFPLLKYAEIIRILRHLCEDGKTKPPGMSSEFSKYIIVDYSGNYVLNEEGKDKMIRTVDTGWLAANKAEEFGSPKTIKILVLFVVIVALIRGIALVIHLFLNH